MKHMLHLLHSVLEIVNLKLLFSAGSFLVMNMFMWKGKGTDIMFELGAQKTLMRFEKYQEKVQKLEFGVPFHLMKSLDRITLMTQKLIETVICDC